jgi:hypothetical protein
MGGAMAGHTAQAAMTDRGEDKASYDLTIERRLAAPVPNVS